MAEGDTTTAANATASETTTNDGPANVSVDQLFWLDTSTLVAATHGRGMFKATMVPGSGYAVAVSKAGAGAGTDPPSRNAASARLTVPGLISGLVVCVIR